MPIRRHNPNSFFVYFPRVEPEVPRSWIVAMHSGRIAYDNSNAVFGPRVQYILPANEPKELLFEKKEIENNDVDGCDKMELDMVEPTYSPETAKAIEQSFVFFVF